MPEQRGGDHLVVVGLGAAFFLVCWVGATGYIAGTLVGGGAPASGLDGAAHVLAGLPGHVADPRQAWPKGDAQLLPGPFALYAAAARGRPPVLNEDEIASITAAGEHPDIEVA